MKPVHREICGRPHYTFVAPYTAPNPESLRLTTVASIQSGGVSSACVVITEDWTAIEPDVAIFLDDELKPQKPSLPRPMTVAESTKHHALKGDYQKPVPSLPSIASVLHQKVVAAMKRGIPACVVVRDLMAKTVRLFKGYSTEYRYIVENRLNTYQALEA